MGGASAIHCQTYGKARWGENLTHTKMEIVRGRQAFKRRTKKKGGKRKGTLLGVKGGQEAVICAGKNKE